MCDCKKILEARLLKRFEETTPEGEDHKVELMGYGMIFGNDGKLSYKPVMEVKQECLHTFKNGNKKAKKVKLSLVLSHCPHCGALVDPKPESDKKEIIDGE